MLACSEIVAVLAGLEKTRDQWALLILNNGDLLPSLAQVRHCCVVSPALSESPT